MPEQTYHAAARSQLERLATLTNVVYAVALVVIITWLPLPEESHATGAVWNFDLWAEYSNNIIAVVIGLVFTIIYWLRSNTLMTTLDRTDGVHTGLSIASVFFLLLLLYVVRVSADVAAPSRRAGESVAVALIGIAAGAAWWWARRKNLVREGIYRRGNARRPDRGLCRASVGPGDPALCIRRRADLEPRLACLYPDRRIPEEAGSR